MQEAPYEKGLYKEQKQVLDILISLKSNYISWELVLRLWEKFSTKRTWVSV